jgi:tetratricopeptide (TPR) repeat protein
VKSVKIDRREKQMKRMFGGLVFGLLIIAATVRADDAISKDVNTHEFRMLLLAAQQPVALEMGITSAAPMKIMDMASFEGEMFTFTPSKEELRDALDAVKLMMEGEAADRKLAIECFEQAVKKNPFDPILMMSLGVCQGMAGKGDLAIATLQKAYDMSPQGYVEKPRIKRNLDQVKDYFKGKDWNRINK